MRLMYDAREPAVVETRLISKGITRTRGDEKDSVISCDDGKVKHFEPQETRAISVCMEKDSGVLFHTRPNSD